MPVSTTVFFQDGNGYQNEKGINTGDREEIVGSWVGHPNSPIQSSKLVIHLLSPAAMKAMKLSARQAKHRSAAVLSDSRSL